MTETGGRLPVRLSESAERDLDLIEDWLTQSGAGSQASDQLQHLFRAIDALSQEAEVWPVIDTARIPKTRGLRKRVAGDYIVGYLIVEGSAGREVVVLRIFGPGQFRG